MGNIYDSIMAGLTEAAEDVQDKDTKLKQRTVSTIPVKAHSAKEIQDIRKRTGFPLTLFASYMGVSAKTVENWEAGINVPSGAVSRILNMMEMDDDLVNKFPFVQSTEAAE
jgi:Predicted transcriptional regulator